MRTPSKPHTFYWKLKTTEAPFTHQMRFSTRWACSTLVNNSRNWSFDQEGILMLIRWTWASLPLLPYLPAGCLQVQKGDTVLLLWTVGSDPTGSGFCVLQPPPLTHVRGIKVSNLFNAFALWNGRKVLSVDKSAWVHAAEVNRRFSSVPRLQ